MLQGSKKVSSGQVALFLQGKYLLYLTCPMGKGPGKSTLRTEAFWYS